MAFVGNDDWGRLCYDFTWNAVGVSICLNFEKTNPTATDFQNLADDAAEQIVIEFMPLLSSEVVANLVTVYDMASDSAPVYTSVSTLPQAGGAENESIPNNCSGVITHRTDSRGRSFRGRTYYPGIPEFDESDGLIGTAAAAAFLAGFDDMIDAIETASNWEHVVASTVSGGVDRTTALLTDVTSLTTTRNIRSQRRRSVTI